MKLLSLLIFLFIAGCASKKEEQMAPVPVTVWQVVPKTIPQNFEFVGVATSSHLVEIRSRVEGYLLKIAYKEGDTVKNGDLLFKIDPRQFEAAVADAEAEVARREAILWAATRSVERYKPLYEQKAASRRDLDDATANALAAEASLDSAKAKLNEACLNLEYTDITSPIEGLAGMAKYREGTLITPAINGLLTTVAVIDPIWVILTISDAYLLKNGQEIAQGTLIYPPQNDFEVRLTLAGGIHFPYTGKMNFASPTLDQSTGTMTLRAAFANPEGVIRPGQFIKAEVIGAKRPNAILVPQAAVQQGGQGMYVYVINEENRASMRPVTVGDWHENMWIIANGLKSGDCVIVDGVNKVVEGSQIVVKTPSKPHTEAKIG